MAPVVRALSARVDEFRPMVCVTNQHQEMLDQVLDLFELRAEHSLHVMTSGQTPNDVTVRVLERLPPVLASTKPAAVLVQGDTTTTFAAALAAFYARIPIGHVEAGLRTYRKDSPFPEELNRQMTTVLADWHYAPTAWARDNLLRAGVAPEAVTVTGNPVTDALHWIADKVGDGADVVPSLRASSRMILVTAHRRENFGAPFVDMCEAMRTLVERHPDVELVYPVHLNPNVQEPVRRILAGLERVHLLAPVDYATLVALLKRCDLVLTDSGGIQEEAPSLGKPVLVMRDTTERPEGIEAGTAKLVGTARDHIIAETERLLDDPAAYASMAHAHNPYGDGHAGECIAEALAAALAAPPKMGS
jgi:UDP-N-acetylglucosamine 2-epimerase (hydrolysing)